MKVMYATILAAELNRSCTTLAEVTSDAPNDLISPTDRLRELPLEYPIPFIHSQSALVITGLFAIAALIVTSYQVN